jgi:uncharacterized membrane protein YphA (DoxX/SURF4 family)
MEWFVKAGRIGFALGLGAIGVQQCFYADFRPVILPPRPFPVPGTVLWAWLVGIALVLTALAIIFNKKARNASLLSGGLLLLFFVLGHIPYELFYDPNSRQLGVWTNPLKELALSGSAFLVAVSFPGTAAVHAQSALIRSLEKLIPAGRIFFSAMLICFGIDHFLYTGFVSVLVPAWIPGPVFWTYFSGVALAGSGLAILLRIKIRLVAILLGIMIFCWLILLHIPRAIADPYGDKGNEVTSVFEALAFSGIALVIAEIYGRRRKQR